MINSVMSNLVSLFLGALIAMMLFVWYSVAAAGNSPIWIPGIVVVATTLALMAKSRQILKK